LKGKAGVTHRPEVVGVAGMKWFVSLDPHVSGRYSSVVVWVWRKGADLRPC